MSFSNIFKLVILFYISASSLGYSQTNDELKRQVGIAKSVCNANDVKGDLTIYLKETLNHIKASDSITSFNNIAVSTNDKSTKINFNVRSGATFDINDAVDSIDLVSSDLLIGYRPIYLKKQKSWQYRCFIYYVANSPYTTLIYNGWLTKIY